MGLDCVTQRFHGFQREEILLRDWKGRGRVNLAYINTLWVGFQNENNSKHVYSIFIPGFYKFTNLMIYPLIWTRNQIMFRIKLSV